MLYLLHGCCDSYVSWTRSTDIEELTKDLDLLVVMPDGGEVGFYSDWRSGPAWETFHLTELPALLAQEYGAAEPRAIAGVSMGGLGALGYAARHPGMFRAVASFSGIVHTRLTPGHRLGLSRTGAAPRAVSRTGSGATRRSTRRSGVSTTPTTWSTGCREPRSISPAATASQGRWTPTAPPTRSRRRSGRENEALAKRLEKLQPEATVHLYEPGTHNWVYWERELHRAWPMITQALGV